MLYNNKRILNIFVVFLLFLGVIGVSFGAGIDVPGKAIVKQYDLDQRFSKEDAAKWGLSNYIKMDVSYTAAVDASKRYKFDPETINTDKKAIEFAKKFKTNLDFKPDLGGLPQVEITPESKPAEIGNYEGSLQIYTKYSPDEIYAYAYDKNSNSVVAEPVVIGLDRDTRLGAYYEIGTDIYPAEDLNGVYIPMNLVKDEDPNGFGKPSPEIKNSNLEKISEVENPEMTFSTSLPTVPGFEDMSENIDNSLNAGTGKLDEYLANFIFGSDDPAPPSSVMDGYGGQVAGLDSTGTKALISEETLNEATYDPYLNKVVIDGIAYDWRGSNTDGKMVLEIFHEGEYRMVTTEDGQQNYVVLNDNTERGTFDIGYTYQFFPNLNPEKFSSEVKDLSDEEILDNYQTRINELYTDQKRFEELKQIALEKGSLTKEQEEEAMYLKASIEIKDKDLTEFTDRHDVASMIEPTSDIVKETQYRDPMMYNEQVSMTIGTAKYTPHNLNGKTIYCSSDGECFNKNGQGVDSRTGILNGDISANKDSFKSLFSTPSTNVENQPSTNQPPTNNDLGGEEKTPTISPAAQCLKDASKCSGNMVQHNGGVALKSVDENGLVSYTPIDVDGNKLPEYSFETMNSHIDTYSKALAAGIPVDISKLDPERLLAFNIVSGKNLDQKELSNLDSKTLVLVGNIGTANQRTQAAESLVVKGDLETSLKDANEKLFSEVIAIGLGKPTSANVDKTFEEVALLEENQAKIKGQLESLDANNAEAQSLLKSLDSGEFTAENKKQLEELLGESISVDLANYQEYESLDLEYEKNVDEYWDLVKEKNFLEEPYKVAGQGKSFGCSMKGDTYICHYTDSNGIYHDKIFTDDPKKFMNSLIENLDEKIEALEGKLEIQEKLLKDLNPNDIDYEGQVAELKDTLNKLITDNNGQRLSLEQSLSLINKQSNNLENGELGKFQKQIIEDACNANPKNCIVGLMDASKQNIAFSEQAKDFVAQQVASGDIKLTQDQIAEVGFNLGFDNQNYRESLIGANGVDCEGFLGSMWCSVTDKKDVEMTIKQGAATAALSLRSEYSEFVGGKMSVVTKDGWFTDETMEVDCTGKNQRACANEYVTKCGQQFKTEGGKTGCIKQFEAQMMGSMKLNSEDYNEALMKKFSDKNGLNCDSVESCKTKVDWECNNGGDRQKCNELKLEFEEFDNQIKVEVGYGYGLLAALRNPDANAMRVAEELFGFEADYSNLPSFLGEDAATNICLGKIEGYLDKELDNNGGTTKYGCSKEYNEDDVDAAQGKALNCVEVLGDIRAQRTVITPEDKTTISFSYFLRAPESQEVDYVVAVSYISGGSLVKEVVIQKTKLDKDGQERGYEFIDLVIEDVEQVDLNSFEVHLGGFIGNSPYVNIKAPVVLITTGDVMEAVKNGGNSAGNEVAQQQETKTEVTTEDLLDMMNI